MSSVRIQISSGLDQPAEVVTFDPYDPESRLPFPLQLHPAWKLLIFVSLVVVLVEGFKLRKTIILYLVSPEAK